MTEKQKPDGTKELTELTESQMLERILSNMPDTEEVEIDLPSKNKFYSLLDPSKGISLRPMTFDDEKALVTNKKGNLEALNTILERCVSNVRVQDLLQVDKLYLIMKLRELSYGDDYNAEVTCPSCKTDSSIKFILSEFPVTYMEEEITNPATIELPVLKKTLKVSFPRVSDEQYFVNAEFAMANLWRFIEEIDGISRKSVIQKVIPKLPLKDAHTVLDTISTSKYGINTKVRFECVYCSHTENMELPITGDFFTAA